MGWEAYITLGVIAVMAFGLVRNMAGPDSILLGGMTLLMSMGLISPDKFPTPGDMVAGFGNPGLIAIAVLFVVAAGLERTGAMNLITQPLLGRPRSALGAQVRMMLPVAGLSAFLNNTPIVAMFIPVVNDWCRKTGVSPSKLFIPLSYVAILGGTCTLIGTSTNLIVYGLMQDAIANGQATGKELGMFSVTAVGIPALLAACLYLVIASPRLLPSHEGAQTDLANTRDYTLEMLVQPGSVVAGKTIEAAGLRSLPGAYLVEVERDDERFVAVGPEHVLQAGDRLIFAGVAEAVRDLQQFRGLVPAQNQVFKVSDPRSNRCLVEAVVSDRSPLVGCTIREGRFRTRYNAAILAVQRGAKRLKQRIGDITLEAGDTLLIETHPRFVEQYGQSRDFFLVSRVDGSEPPRHQRAFIATAILAALVIVVSLKLMTLLNAGLWAAGLMVLTGCCSSSEARSHINWRVLLTIGSAIGVGKAMDTSGAATGLAGGLLQLAEPLGPVGLLAGIYLITMIFNMMVSHAGAAVLAFPIALAATQSADLNFTPFAIAIMLAASAEFANPVSYPTHLMVYSAGGYKFTDYLRIGLPLNFIVMGVTVAIVPLVWPLAN